MKLKEIVAFLLALSVFASFALLEPIVSDGGRESFMNLLQFAMTGYLLAGVVYLVSRKVPVSRQRMVSLALGPALVVLGTCIVWAVLSPVDLVIPPSGGVAIWKNLGLGLSIYGVLIFAFAIFNPWADEALKKFKT